MQKVCAEVARLGKWLPNAEGLCRSLPVWVSSNETYLKLLSWRSMESFFRLGAFGSKLLA